MNRDQPLAVSIAERIGAVPRRTLVVGGLSSFLKQTIEPKLAAWGLRVEWHREMGSRGSAPLPAGCEVVIYLYEMVANPTHVAAALKAHAQKAGAIFIQASRKSATWEADFTRAGLKHDALYPLKDPIMPPPPNPPKPAALPTPKPRTASDIIADLISGLVELEKMVASSQEAEALRGKLAESTAANAELRARLEAAEKKLEAFDALKALLK
jgi:hypothetical protein